MFIFGFGVNFVENILNAPNDTTMPPFKLYVRLLICLCFTQCTTELEKKPELDSYNKNEEDKLKKEPNKRKDEPEPEKDTTNTNTENNTNQTPTDPEKGGKGENEPKKEVKKELKIDKVTNTEPEKTNPNIIEVVKNAKTKYAFVGNFYHGLAIVQAHEGKYGYIDQFGKEISALKYDFAEDLAGEPAMARVRIRDKVGYIDKYAKEVIPLKYRYIDKFYQGLAQARMLDGDVFYIDKQGNQVCEALSEYHEGIARIKKGDKIGYVNTSGKVVVQPLYNYGTHFTNGLAEVKLKEKYMFINSKGECVKDCQ